MTTKWSNNHLPKPEFLAWIACGPSFIVVSHDQQAPLWWNVPTVIHTYISYSSFPRERDTIFLQHSEGIEWPDSMNVRQCHINYMPATTAEPGCVQCIPLGLLSASLVGGCIDSITQTQSAFHIKFTVGNWWTTGQLDFKTQLCLLIPRFMILYGQWKVYQAIFKLTNLFTALEKALKIH